MEKDKINRLIKILNEAKEIIAELEGYATKKEKQAKTNIREFGFSTRAMSVLLMAEIKTVKDITKYTKYEIQNLRSCGRVSANEIEAKLNAVGIKLAQEEED